MVLVPLFLAAAAASFAGDVQAVLDTSPPILVVVRGQRRLLLDTEGRRVGTVPKDAIFVSACEGTPTFLTPRGIVQRGKLRFAANVLFPVADRGRLPQVTLCEGTEYYVPTSAGVEVHQGSSKTLLRFSSAPRVYDGQGALRTRGYGAAISLYMPRIVRAHFTRGQGLVFTQGERATFYQKTARGYADGVALDLRRACAAAAADRLATSVWQGKLVVTRTRGLVPKRTAIYQIDLDQRGVQSELLAEVDGFFGVMVDGYGFLIDTGTVALGSVLVSGRLPLHIVELPTLKRRASMTISANITRGIVGALPLIKSGPEFVEVDAKGTARVHRGGEVVQEIASPPQARAYMTGAGLLFVGHRSGTTRVLLIDRR